MWKLRFFATKKCVLEANPCVQILWHATHINSLKNTFRVRTFDKFVVSEILIILSRAYPVVTEQYLGRFLLSCIHVWHL